MSKLFAIKPLAWRETFWGSKKRTRWDAETIFCTINIEPEVDYDNPDADGEYPMTGRWWFEAIVDEYHDETRELFDDAELARARAEAWYRDRLMPALEPKQ